MKTTREERTALKQAARAMRAGLTWVETVTLIERTKAQPSS